jgi:hypothetical protein
MLLAVSLGITGCFDYVSDVGAIDAVDSGVSHGTCYFTERVCKNYKTKKGKKETSCRNVRRVRACTIHDRHYRSGLRVLTKDKIAPEHLDIADVADSYYLSLEAAELYINALSLAKRGDASGLEALGLGSDDFKDLAKLRMPADESIARVSDALDQDPLLTKAMIARLVVTAQRLKKEECEALRESDPTAAEQDHLCN